MFDELPGHDGDLDYHARLVADPHRVVAYERALRESVTPDTVVLDVGTGTGLLAVLAARCGARRVHAVESMPVGAAALALIAANGVADRVVVHRGDIRLLEPVEPVDLIVSDFMGRWVFDDQMMVALETAVSRWLKPGGRIIPRTVELYASPVEIHWFEPLDVWRSPLLGVDLRPFRDRAIQQCYGAACAPSSHLARPEAYVTLDTAALGAAAPDATLRWDIQRDGNLRAIAGWFDARLTDQVTLSTVPGVQTHWAQYLFPLTPVKTLAGDLLTARIWLGTGDTWRWAGTLSRAGVPVLEFDHHQLEPSAYRPADPREVEVPSLERAERLNEEGAAHHNTGDYASAASSFAAATRALPADAHPEFSRGVYENMGITCTLAGRPQDAVPALLRALDGDTGSREQSARFLVNACFGAGRHLDGARYLEAYEAVFGPHPSGWSRGGTGGAADESVEKAT